MYQSRPTVAINHTHTHLQYCMLPELSEPSYQRGAQHRLAARMQVLPPYCQISCQGAGMKYHLTDSARLRGVFHYHQPHLHQWSACICTGFKKLMGSLPLTPWLNWAWKCVFETPQVGFSNSTSKVMSCAPILKVRQYTDAWFWSKGLRNYTSASSRHLSMCAWEASTKEGTSQNSVWGCKPARRGRGGHKEYFNCYRRIEETLAEHSVKAAWLHAWSQLTTLNGKTVQLGKESAKKLKRDGWKW